MNKQAAEYNPETYWSEVGNRIQQREEGNVLAGDDSPYYRYKRKRFLQMFNSIPFKGKSVMEIGHGPGGNLKELIKHHPSLITGVDISETMISLAKENLGSDRIQFTKTDGRNINFPDRSHDIVFSATVLQHNSDEEMMKAMFQEMLRVSSDRVYIFERIEKQLKGDELCVGRPVEYYRQVAEQEGFKLNSSTFINIQVSYLVCGAIRKLFNSGKRNEGEQLNAFSVFLQSITLPITSILDKIFKARRNLGKLEFQRKL